MVPGNEANPPNRAQASGKRSRGDDKLQQAQRKYVTLGNRLLAVKTRKLSRVDKAFVMHRRVKLIAVREQLPVWTARKALLQHIKDNDCLVVVGETGSGKTTQIPQLLVKAGLAEQGCIACTQPRRVAAITVAGRVAQEYPCHLGQEASQNLRCYVVVFGYLRNRLIS